MLRPPFFGSAAMVSPVSTALLLSYLSALAGWGGQRCEGTPVRSSADFSFLAGGSQVFDHQTGLIWLRCLEGQEWNGSTCKAADPKAVNPGPSLTFAAAKRLAATRSKPPAEVWRLPTKAELLTIREPRCYNPSFSLELFPSEPAWSSDGHFWTSTREAKGVSVVDAIGASDAWSTTAANQTAHVRLVRKAPKGAR